MVVMMGIQGSGKSTFYQKYLKDDYVRINLDTLKTRHREQLLIQNCINHGRNIAIDHTNPTKADRQDYFLWRQEDAHRNALNAHCYWLLRKEGMDARSATAALEGKSIAYKNELLFSRGINFDRLPAWQKRGIGVYWADIEIIYFRLKYNTLEVTLCINVFGISVKIGI